MWLYFSTEADSHSKLCDQTPMLYLTNKKAGFGFLGMVLGFFFSLVLFPILPFAAKKKSFVVSWFCCLGVFYTKFVMLAQTVAWFSDLLMYIR